MLLSWVADVAPDLHFPPSNMVAMEITFWFYCNSSTVVFACAVKTQTIVSPCFCKKVDSLLSNRDFLERVEYFARADCSDWLANSSACRVTSVLEYHTRRRAAWKSSFKWPRYRSHLERWGIMLHLEWLPLPKRRISMPGKWSCTAWKTCS